MSLLTPLALALGVTLPIVVVFYLLKVRRYDEEVSSTFLWNDLIRDLATHEPLLAPQVEPAAPPAAAGASADQLRRRPTPVSWFAITAYASAPRV